MLEFLGLFAGIISVFAFEPVRCGVVAAVFTVAIFLPRYGWRRRILFGIAATAWWGFTWLEAHISPTMTFRLDLAALSPFLVGSAALGFWALFAKKPHQGPA